MSWIVQNWQLKLLAFVLSLGLFSAVAFQQNPIRTPQLSAPVSYRGLSSSLILVGAPTTLKIYVVGLAGDISALTPNSVTVEVDVSKVKHGSQVVYGKPKVVAANVRPQLDTIPFNLNVDDLMTVRIPVEPRVSFAPGWQPVPDQTRVTDPKQLTVVGPAADLTGLKAYVAFPTPVTGSEEISGLAISFERDGRTVTLPADTIPKVTVEPKQVATLHIEASKVAQTRKVPLIETPTGSPAPGYRITAIVIDPLFIDITGSVDDLASVNGITLPAIAVDGFSASVTRTVRLANLPANVTTAVGSVNVTITIQQNPAVQPSPSPPKP